MRRLIAMAFIVFSILAPIVANAACNTFENGLMLKRPDVGDNFNIWASCIRETIGIINNNSVSTTTLSTLQTGHKIKEHGVLLPTVSTLNFTGSGVTVTQVGDQLDINISTTLSTIRSTATALGVQTTTSGSWESVSGSTLTLVSEISNFLEIGLSCNIECVDHTQCGVAFGYIVDGDYFDGGSSSTSNGIKYLETNASTVGSPSELIINHKTGVKLSPGSHTISLLWASNGGVPVRMGRNMRSCSLVYKESPEQFNSGGAATVSGATNLGSQTFASLQSLSCPVLPCQAQESGRLYDIWVATGSLPGQWMNTRTGTGPY